MAWRPLESGGGAAGGSERPTGRQSRGVRHGRGQGPRQCHPGSGLEKAELSRRPAEVVPKVTRMWARAEGPAAEPGGEPEIVAAPDARRGKSQGDGNGPHREDDHR